MCRVRGSSLIECLVALAIFAIGSAAHATWQAHSLAMHARASRSFAATTVALNLATRLRAARRRDAREAKPANMPALARFEQELRAMVGARATGTVACDPDDSCRIRIAWAGREELSWHVPAPSPGA